MTLLHDYADVSQFLHVQPRIYNSPSCTLFRPDPFDKHLTTIRVKDLVNVTIKGPFREYARFSRSTKSFLPFWYRDTVTFLPFVFFFHLFSHSLMPCSVYYAKNYEFLLSWRAATLARCIKFCTRQNFGLILFLYRFDFTTWTAKKGTSGSSYEDQ